MFVEAFKRLKTFGNEHIYKGENECSFLFFTLMLRLSLSLSLPPHESSSSATSSYQKWPWMQCSMAFGTSQPLQYIIHGEGKERSRQG